MPCPQPERLEPCSWDRELTFQLFPSSPTEQGIFILSPAGSCRSLVFDWPDTFTFTSAGQDLQLGRWADCLHDQDLRVLVWRGFELFVGGVNRGCRWCELAELIEQVTCENTFSAAFLTGSCWSTQWWVTDCQRMMLRWACPLVLYANEQSCDVATANRLFGLFHLLQHRRVLNAAVEL